MLRCGGLARYAGAASTPSVCVFHSPVHRRRFSLRTLRRGGHASSAPRLPFAAAAVAPPPPSQRGRGRPGAAPSPPERRPPALPPSPPAASPPAQPPLSNRAAFRALPLDARVVERIGALRLCADAREAGRVAAKARAAGDERPRTRRYPLYGELPDGVRGVMLRRGGGDGAPPVTKFSAAAKAGASLPLPRRPEVAFAGRSNVGKSSLVNAVTLSAAARSSDKPGLTQSLNFYDVGDSLTLVDLPGYGFAFAADEAKAAWNALMDDYLVGRGTILKRVFLVLDARHGLKSNDREFLLFLSRVGLKTGVVLNKTDVVRPDELARRWHQLTTELATVKGAQTVVHMISTATGAGVAALAADICRLATASGKDNATEALPRTAMLIAAGEGAPARRPLKPWEVPPPGEGAAAAPRTRVAPQQGRGQRPQPAARDNRRGAARGAGGAY